MTAGRVFFSPKINDWLYVWSYRNDDWDVNRNHVVSWSRSFASRVSFLLETETNRNSIRDVVIPDKLLGVRSGHDFIGKISSRKSVIGNLLLCAALQRWPTSISSQRQNSWLHTITSWCSKRPRKVTNDAHNQGQKIGLDATAVPASRVPTPRSFRWGSPIVQHLGLLPIRSICDWCFQVANDTLPSLFGV